LTAEVTDALARLATRELFCERVAKCVERHRASNETP
jgi:hypothetical protein